VRSNKLFALLTLTALLCSSNVVAQEPTKIAIVYPGAISASGSMAFAIAHDQGIFAKYGLEARLLGGLLDQSEWSERRTNLVSLELRACYGGGKFQDRCRIVCLREIFHRRTIPCLREARTRACTQCV
jgi:hypothetical protein